ncbi:DnaD domain protein [Metabacillus sp. FJAT-52054]|uniref:DnaD domain protein n=1 Tax=Metabacillus sediminis TaxID=3117746 RepID=A0ABZ2NPC9_9BACI
MSDPTKPNAEEELLNFLKSASPEEVLSSVSGGIALAEAELNLIIKLRTNYKLVDPVINVLLYYVLLRTDMKLPASYVEKIAIHWARKNITTAEEALHIAKTEHKEYLRLNNLRKGQEVSPDQITILDSIRGAIKADLTDEQLGKYVRNVLLK